MPDQAPVITATLLENVFIATAPIIFLLFSAALHCPLACSNRALKPSLILPAAMFCAL